MSNSPLSAKQDRFCHEYIIDCNATQAAIRAGYSKKTARQQGQRLLTKVDVKQRISELQTSTANKLDLRAENVLGGLIRNEQEAYEQGKLAESTRALQLLGRHLGIFKENIQVEQQVRLGPRTIVMTQADGTVIEENKEAAEEARRQLGHIASASESMES